MTERQELIAEAEELGLSFAKNAKTEKIKKAGAEAKAEAILDKAREDEGVIENEVDTEFVEDEETPEVALQKEVLPGLDGPSESDIRAQIEAEMEAKFEEKMAITIANMEKNINAKTTGKQVPFGRARLDAIKKATSLVRVVVICRDPMKAAWEGEIFNVSNDVIGEQKKYVPFNIEEGYHIPRIIYNAMKDKKCTVFVNKRINGEQVKVGKQINAYGIEILPPLTKDELSDLAADQSARMAIDAS